LPPHQSLGFFRSHLPDHGRHEERPGELMSERMRFAEASGL
jgi:hypothetical protein